MNITYSLISCATIKECADNYTLEQWASRVDFNASPITKMLLPISPLCYRSKFWEHKRKKIASSRGSAHFRSVSGFDAAPLFLRQGWCARAQPWHSVADALLFVINWSHITFCTCKCPGNITDVRKTSEDTCFLMGWYLKHRLTHSWDVDKELVIAQCAYNMLSLLYRNISFTTLKIKSENKYLYIFFCI